MKQNELVDAFRTECESLAALVAAKNSNYSGVNGNGAFHNFGIVEHITGGHITREAGAMVRITDKVARLFALLDGNADEVGESFGDTCMDLAGYALLLKLMYTDRTAGAVSQGEVLPAPQHSNSAWEHLTRLVRG